MVTGTKSKHLKTPSHSGFFAVIKNLLTSLLLTATFFSTYIGLITPEKTFAASQSVIITVTGTPTKDSNTQVTNTQQGDNIAVKSVNPTLIAPTPAPASLNIKTGVDGGDGISKGNGVFSFNQEDAATQYKFKVAVTYNGYLVDNVTIVVTGTKVQIAGSDDNSGGKIAYSASGALGVVSNDQAAVGISSSQSTSSYYNDKIRCDDPKLSFSSDPFTSMSCAAITALQNVMATVMQWGLKLAVNQIPVAKDIAFASAQSPAELQWAKTLYTIALNLVNYLIVLILLFLSFVNILHINIDTYAIKKIMPTIIIGVILANFSLLITRFIVDSSEVLTAALLGNNPGQFTLDFVNAFGGHIFQNTIGAAGVVGIVTALFAFPGVAAPVALGFLFIMLIPFCLMIVLALLFWLRYYVLVMLAALSPLAFAALATPMTQPYFKQWWSNVLKWTFMAPIAFFFLNIAALIGNSAGSESWSSMAAAILMTYLAITIPWKLGGAVAATWSGALKKSGAYAGKFADKTLGDVQEAFHLTRSTPLTFFKGWKERTDEQYHHHELIGKGAGKASREAFSRGISELVRTKSPKSAFQAAQTGHAEVLGRTQGQARIEELVKIGQYGVNKSADDLNGQLDVAIQSGNTKAITELAAQSMGGGHMNDELYSRVMKSLEGQSDIGDITAALGQLSRANPISQMVAYQKFTKDDHGKNVLLSDVDPHAEQRSADQAIKSAMRGLTDKQIVAKLNSLAQANLIDKATDKPLSPDKIVSGFQRALLKHMKDYESTIATEDPSGKRGAAKALKNLAPDNLEAHFGTNLDDTFGATGTTPNNDVHRIVTQAGSFNGINIPTKPTKDYVNNAVLVNTHWDAINNANTGVMKKQYEDLKAEIEKISGAGSLPAYDATKSIGRQLRDFESKTSNKTVLDTINSNETARNTYLALQSTGRAHDDLYKMKTDFDQRGKSNAWQNLMKKPGTP